MRYSRIPLVLAILLAVAFGCGPRERMIGGKVRPKTYKTAVSLSPGCTEILRTKALLVNLLGRTASCNYPTVDPNARIVMKGTKPNYEMIAKLKPDIVLYDPDLFSDGDIAKLEELGLETFALGGATVEEFIDRLYRLGSKLGVEQVINDYVEEIRGAMSLAKADPFAKPPKVAVLLPAQGGEHLIAGTRSFQADVVRVAGGEPVGPEAPHFVTVNVESLVTQNPDVIVAAGDAKLLEADPRLAAVSAVKAGRVIRINPDVLLRRGARVQDLIRGVHDALVNVVKTSLSQGGSR